MRNTTEVPIGPLVYPVLKCAYDAAQPFRQEHPRHVSGAVFVDL